MNIYIENEKWNKSTKLAFAGVLLQTVFGFLSLLIVIFLTYNISNIFFQGLVESLSSMSLDYYEDTFMKWSVVITILTAISFLGYIVYLIGISLFKGAQQSPDSEMRTKYIMMTEIIMPCLLILLIIVVANNNSVFLKDIESVLTVTVIMWIVSMAAVIFLLIQFKSLAKEASWAEEARKGAGNVKFSYYCIIWCQVVILLGLGILALSVYSFYKNISTQSFQLSGMYGAVDGINSFSRLVHDFSNIIQIEIILTGILLLFFAALQTVYRIMGWNQIRLGTAGIPVSSTDALPSEEPEQGMRISSVTYYDEEDEENGKKNKWLMYGGIGAGVILLLLVIWALRGNNDTNKPITEGKQDVKSVEEITKVSESYVESNEEAHEMKEVFTESVEESDEVSVASKRPQFGGTLEMEGKIDDKYAITMEILEFADGSISGDYRYVKNNVPIVLNGSYTESDGSHEITLEERVDGNVTGCFVGNFDGVVFEGYWVSSDGERTLPFRLER